MTADRSAAGLAFGSPARWKSTWTVTPVGEPEVWLVSPTVKSASRPDSAAAGTAVQPRTASSAGTTRILARMAISPFGPES